MESVNITYLWRGKKTVLGLPIGATKYAVSEEKIFIEKGAMKTEDAKTEENAENTEEKEIALEEINDISVTTSSMEKFFKVGTVVIKYGENKECKLESIKQPMMVSELIHQYVEKARGIKSYSI